MNISAIAASGVQQAASGFEKAFDKLASTPNPVDAVNLSEEAVTLSERHIAYSLALKTLKIADEIEKLGISVVG